MKVDEPDRRTPVRFRWYMPQSHQASQEFKDSDDLSKPPTGSEKAEMEEMEEE